MYSQRRVWYCAGGGRAPSAGAPIAASAPSRAWWRPPHRLLLLELGGGRHVGLSCRTKPGEHRQATLTWQLWERESLVGRAGAIGGRPPFALPRRVRRDPAAPGPCQQLQGTSWVRWRAAMARGAAVNAHGTIRRTPRPPIDTKTRGVTALPCTGGGVPSWLLRAGPAAAHARPPGGRRGPRRVEGV